MKYGCMPFETVCMADELIQGCLLLQLLLRLVHLQQQVSQARDLERVRSREKARQPLQHRCRCGVQRRRWRERCNWQPRRLAGSLAPSAPVEEAGADWNGRE